MKDINKHDDLINKKKLVLNPLYITGDVILPDETVELNFNKASRFVTAGDKTDEVVKQIVSGNIESATKAIKDNLGYAVVFYPAIKEAQPKNNFAIGTLVKVNYLNKKGIVSFTGITPVYCEEFNNKRFINIVQRIWEQKTVSVINKDSNKESIKEFFVDTVEEFEEKIDKSVSESMRALWSEFSEGKTREPQYFLKKANMLVSEQEKLVTEFASFIANPTPVIKHSILSTENTILGLEYVKSLILGGCDLSPYKLAQPVDDEFSDEELNKMNDEWNKFQKDSDDSMKDSALELIKKKEEELNEELELEDDLSTKTYNKIKEENRLAFLHKKLEVLQKELGMTSQEKANHYRTLIEERDIPESVKEKIEKELLKLTTLHPGSADYPVTIEYLDNLFAMPWGVVDKDDVKMKEARKKLDASHYGMEDVKERILEHIAIQKHTKTNSTILCLVGPPGVGKTSIAKSIADSIGREFVKTSLGGVSDEHYIRGHQKTYIGSMPGQIVKGLQKAGVNNPVFLLDEIDKLAASHQGDPAAALLEVLDPEQNKHFRDHYVDEEIDLSNVMFIATANYPQDIPDALYDRLEIIQLSSYTEVEKINIATQHLIPKMREVVGLDESCLSISEQCLPDIIYSYTYESGVRQLERNIDAIGRKALLEILESDDENHKVHITQENLEDYLGRKKVKFKGSDKTDTVGLVTGLAYTSYGGDVLPIEATLIPGNGTIHMTGQLGDVMSESAELAYAYVRSNHKKLNIDLNQLHDYDVHIHVPQGAVPKDGPSAGIALTTVLASLLTNKKIKGDVAMTGEVTLHGKVLAIGGLKEKSIAAHRDGIKTVIVPEDNIDDIEDLPEVVLQEVKFVPVSDMDEVLKVAFVDGLSNE